MFDLLDARLGVLAVRQYADLRPKERTRAQPKFVNRHTEQRNRNLFARGQQNVQLFGRGVVRQLFCQRRESIGLAAHGRHDNHHVMTFPPESRDAFRDRPDPFR